MSNGPAVSSQKADVTPSSLPEVARRPDPTTQETDQRKHDFLAILAHELRNPLEPILNAVDILQTKGPPNRELLECQGIIVRQVQQMARLLDDLMDVARLTHDKLELRLEKAQLADLVEAARETSAPLIARRAHKLTIQLPAHPIYLQVDPTRIGQIFANLLNNAAKFTDPGGRILLTAEPMQPLSGEPGTVVVRIKDNGRGISAEMLPEVFDMFVQEESLMERSQAGLGLGLPLAKRLAEMHGGSIEAHSDGRGRGSEFTVRLPVLLAQRTAEANTGSGQALPVATPKRALRVLVVEDNVDAAQSLSLLLQLRRNNVVTALDGVEGVEAAAAFQPDLILLDIGLPKLNGYEAAKRIRQERGDSRLVIVALTGWGQEEDKRQSQEAGINLHLVKPVDSGLLDQLLAVTPVLD